MTQIQSQTASPFAWDDYSDTSVGRYLQQREYAFVKQTVCTENRPERILDVACGSGRITRPLKELGLNVTGIDLGATALTAFRRHSHQVPLARSDAQQLPFADDSFDCVIGIQCFEYFNHEQFLPECRRVLSAGGLLIFDFINQRNYKRIISKLLKRNMTTDAQFHRNCQDVFTILAAYGFDVQRARGYNWIPFHRKSNPGFVDATAQIEKVLHLETLYAISPWVLVAARKRNLS